MVAKLVESIPNFSEGRRPEVISAIGNAISGVPGVSVLDQHTDADHNRTVFTFAGPPDAVSEAAYNAIQTAAEWIDMDQHTGEHPRIGATDVVPFVPLSNVTMNDCVDLARKLAQRVGEELHIPTYLYEAAATRPDRKNLEDIRRGEYEALKVAIATDPDREPDFGPMRLGKAGATVIGARAPLIAFNVYLATDDVSIARKIARAIRHSSGGLRFLKALGLFVEGRAQVSMNLTDYTRTPVARVVELIRQEAQRYGTAIHHSELVGLIPQAALVDAAQWYLQLDGFQPDQILESRLYAARQDQSDREGTFLEQLSSGSATPGGGSAAAYTGAMGASLVAMVARLTMGKKKYAEIEERMQAISDQAERLRNNLEESVSHDAEAFQAVMQAYAMPKANKGDQAKRSQAVELALHEAAAVPLEVAGNATSVLELALEVARIGNINAITDAGSAGALAMAALKAASMNVRVNAASASDKEAAQKWIDEITRLEQRVKELESDLNQTLAERGGISVPA
jgi:glutamate formiminotransferase/formiminotetrahydrofolate cyclodeaminase